MIVAHARTPRPRLRPSLLGFGLVPTGVWYLLFMAIPLGILAVISLWRVQNFNIIPEWTLDNYGEAIGDPVYTTVMLKSLKIALITTVISVLLAYVVAYVLAKKVHRAKLFWLFLVIVPFWTSYLLRAYAWMAILGNEGVINRSLLGMGLIDRPIEVLLYSQYSLTLGFIHVFFPFAVLAIYASLEKVDDSLVLAARDLGANPFRAFREVTLPLTTPGVVAAILFVFLPTLGEYVTPKLLGGPNGTMISNLLVNQFGASMQWDIGSALAFILMAITFVVVMILTRYASLEKLY
jgi:spermidine/putrescine transport system permease protein